MGLLLCSHQGETIFLSANYSTWAGDHRVHMCIERNSGLYYSQSVFAFGGLFITMNAPAVSNFEGFFEGPKTFLAPKMPESSEGQF